jgi:hypothetical protein
VDPHSAEVDRRIAQLVIGVTETLEDTRNVSQVECVVRLVWSGLKWAIEHIVVNSESHLTQAIQGILDFSGEVVHKGIDDCEEDSVD